MVQVCAPPRRCCSRGGSLTGAWPMSLTCMAAAARLCPAGPAQDPPVLAQLQVMAQQVQSGPAMCCQSCALRAPPAAAQQGAVALSVRLLAMLICAKQRAVHNQSIVLSCLLLHQQGCNKPRVACVSCNTAGSAGAAQQAAVSTAGGRRAEVGGAAAPGAGPSGRWPRLLAGAEQGGGATSRLSAMQLAAQKPGSGVPPLARPSAGQQQQEGVLPQELATDGSLPPLPRSPGEGLAHLQSTARMHTMGALPSPEAGSCLSDPSPRACYSVPSSIFSRSKVHLCHRQDRHGPHEAY